MPTRQHGVVVGLATSIRSSYSKKLRTVKNATEGGRICLPSSHVGLPVPHLMRLFTSTAQRLYRPARQSGESTFTSPKFHLVFIGVQLSLILSSRPWWKLYDQPTTQHTLRWNVPPRLFIVSISSWTANNVSGSFRDKSTKVGCNKPVIHRVRQLFHQLRLHHQM